MILVLWGVSGSGKSHIGKMLAEQLDWRFIDADDFHSYENIHKMQQGAPLNDADRLPWLATLAAEVSNLLANDSQAILACSALRKSYRELLGVNNKSVVAVLLTGPTELIEQRLKQRQHAFMSNNLLQSQLAALELPEQGLVIDIAQTPEEVSLQIIHALGLGSRR
ncbi:MAG: gluconokinase [Candidatus Azotimanducaceae bacterium]|jgi:gluconokinase